MPLLLSGLAAGSLLCIWPNGAEGSKNGGTWVTRQGKQVMGHSGFPRFSKAWMFWEAGGASTKGVGSVDFPTVRHPFIYGIGIAQVDFRLFLCRSATYLLYPARSTTWIH